MLPFKARIGEIEDKKTGKKVHACRCRRRRKEEAEGGGRQTDDGITKVQGGVTQTTQSVKCLNH